MIRRDSILIALTSSELSGYSAAHGSHVIEQIALDPEHWQAAWEDGLRSVDEPLKRVLARLKARSNPHVAVLYDAPTTVADVHTVPAMGAAAIAAADLALRGSVSAPSDDLQARFRILARSDGTHASPARTFVLAAAESPATAATIGAWLARAGARPGPLVPLINLAACEAIRLSLAGKHPGLHAMLWLGRTQSVLVCMRDGSVQFVRTLGIGYGQLAEALYRAARTKTQAATFDRSYAAALVRTVGLPRRGHLVDPQHQIRAEDVLPLMQSVLQRFVVEVRQSLRFGLAGEESARLSLLLSGPGASIQGFADVMSEQLEIPVEIADPAASGESECGEFAVARASDLEDVAFVPPEVEIRRRQRRLNMAAAAGLAIAGIAIAGDTMLAWQKAQTLEARTAELEPRLRDMQEATARAEQARSLAVKVSEAEGLLVDALGDRPAWAAMLAQITRDLGPRLRLDEISADYSDKDVPHLTLRGYYAGADGSADPLASFVDRLEKSPFVESADVTSTRAQAESGLKLFIVTVKLRTAPIELRQAAAGGGQ